MRSFHPLVAAACLGQRADTILLSYSADSPGRLRHGCS